MPRTALVITLLIAGSISSPALNAAQAPETDSAKRFTDTVRPFLASYCAGCHSGATPAGSFDVAQLSKAGAPVRDHSHWANVLTRLTSREMPPKQMPQPTERTRQQVIAWIGEMRKSEAAKSAGDPGVVTARRLSNSEYNYTIRDLTGQDLRPAREFPVDPANRDGFDNSGETLKMSAELMAKYLLAAREVANNMVLKPTGFDFAPHPMLVETDRDKYSVNRIVDFYNRQPTDFADYFEAAWRYKHRAALGEPKATLAGVAASSKVSPKYLPVIWQTLEQTKEEVGPLVTLQTMWRALPAPRDSQLPVAREGFVQMRDFVARIRKHTAKLYTSPVVTGMNANAQPLISLRNRRIAAQHREFEPTALRVEGEPPAPEMVVTKGPPFGKGEQDDLKIAIADYIKERKEDPDLAVPAGQRERYEAAFARFSNVFPDKFALRERGRFYPIDSLDHGRYLSSGLHSVMGFFRDDTALIELILDEKGKQEIDTLWQEFEFIADFSARTYLQSVFNGGGGQDRAAGIVPAAPALPKETTTEQAIFATRDQLLARVLAANNPVVNQAVRDHYANLSTPIQWAKRARLEAEPHHLEALVAFAARAYRRSLAPEEREDILAYYRELRAKNDLTHEEAIRASIVTLLVSPDFCYRVDLVE